MQPRSSCPASSKPCSIGSSLLFIKYLDDKEAPLKVAETVLFALTRALFIGLLGFATALLGAAFLRIQRGAWILLGAGYALIGALYAAGRARALMISLGPRIKQLS